MKNYEKIIAEAVRVEYSESDGKVYVVFEITDQKTKQNIRKTWVDDIEFKLINKVLVSEEG